MTDPLKLMGTDLLQQAMTARNTNRAQSQAGQKAETRKACQGFESLFVNYMMQQMRKTVPQSGWLGGGQAERIYTSMLDNEVAKTVSEQRGIGLARIMYEQMTAADSPQRIKK